MRNNPVGLFVSGIAAGGILMSLIIVLSQSAARPGSRPGSTSTPGLPAYLIALEPTHVRLNPTHGPVPPSAAVTPGSPSADMAIGPGSTPLRLQTAQRPEIVGYSVEGRPLEVYRFGAGGRERMIVAGIHGGDEWNTVALANRLIEHLDRDPGLVPEGVTLYILPSLNPDGEARAHDKYGRLNHNGVDLNRNFPVNWKQEWDRAGCWNSLPSSGGTDPGSEPETQALMKFIEAHSLGALISYHSAALGIFPGGLPWDESSIRLAESLAEVTSYPFPPIDTGCAYSGTLADYAVSAGIAAVDLELTNHFDTDFDQNLQALRVLLDFGPSSGRQGP